MVRVSLSCVRCISGYIHSLAGAPWPVAARAARAGVRMWRLFIRSHRRTLDTLITVLKPFTRQTLPSRVSFFTRSAHDTRTAPPVQRACSTSVVLGREREGVVELPQKLAKQRAFCAVLVAPELADALAAPHVPQLHLALGTAMPATHMRRIALSATASPGYRSASQKQQRSSPRFFTSMRPTEESSNPGLNMVWTQRAALSRAHRRDAVRRA